MQNGDLDEIRNILRDIAAIQGQQAKTLLHHAEILAEHDERMDRVGRHLEVLSDICDGLIRDKADKKKRS